MTHIEINADGRHVIVDADGELDVLAKTAMSLWEHAESYQPPGPATGFSDTERRWSAAARSWSMRDPLEARDRPGFGQEQAP